jgi:hypothetical protein
MRKWKWVFFVKKNCNNTWTFQIKFLSHNIIFPWLLVHNTFIFFDLELWFREIPSFYWHCDEWPKCNSALCMLIQSIPSSYYMCGGWPRYNTLLICIRYFTSIKGSSSNSRWAWRCNGGQWMGSWRLKMVLQGGASTSSYVAKWFLCKHLEQTFPSNANWEIKTSIFSS